VYSTSCLASHEHFASPTRLARYVFHTSTLFRSLAHHCVLETTTRTCHHSSACLRRARRETPALNSIPVTRLQCRTAHIIKRNGHSSQIPVRTIIKPFSTSDRYTALGKNAHPPNHRLESTFRITAYRPPVWHSSSSTPPPSLAGTWISCPRMPPMLAFIPSRPTNLT